MAYAVKYLFKFQSSNGTVREIRVLQDGYSGSVIQRPLGRAPVIKKEKNGGVHGTSLTFYAECHIDREYIEFYTSDPKEYRVDVYAGSTLLWQGYITPELYSEPDIAPPYDVQVVATDGVGELKLYDFAPQGTVTLRALLAYLLGYTGLTTDVNLVSSLKPGSRGAGALLDMQICVDYLAGKTCYEALTYILTTLHATITRWGGAWVLVRETNVTFTNDKVRYFNTSGNSALLTGSVQTLGAMRSAPAWPVGQLSTVIDPAKNKVVVQAPWHPVSGLANSDMTSDTGWTKDKNARYDTDGYVLPTNVLTPVSETAVISQAVSLVGLRVALSISVKATGSTSEIAGQAYGALMGVFVTYKVGNVTYYLIKGEDGAPAWEQGDNIGTYVPPRTRVDYQQTLSVWDASRIEAEELKIDNIPPFLSGTSFPSGTLTVYILGSCVKVYGAYLDVVLPKGYQDILRIDNGARGEGDSVEIAIGRVTSEVAYYQSFLQGLLLDSGSLITAFSDANFTTAMDYLALISRDYALSAALPRALAKGTVYLESSIGLPPLVFAKGGLNYWLETWSWDLYEDELEIDARTLPSASLTVQSETILESDGSTVSSSSSGSSGGGSSISPGGGVTYFEPHNDGIILKSDYDYVSVPDVLLGDEEESLNAALAVIAGNAVQGAAAYGYFSDGVLPYNHGGTGLSSYTKGDLIYASANDTLAKLAANSTETKKFLTMTSSVPSWDGIAFGDLPTLYWANVAVSSSSSTTTEPTVKSITIGGATFTWHPESVAGAGDAYLELNSAFVTSGDQIVGDGTPGGGGGAGFLYDLGDVYASGDDVLRADGTARQAGDALVYNTTHGWVAAPVQASGDYLPLSAGSDYPLTGALYMNNRLYMRGGNIIEFDASDNSFRALFTADSNNDPVWYKGSAWYTMLTTNNYTSYALPRSGGSSYPMTGTLYVKVSSGIVSSGNQAGYSVVYQDADYNSFFGEPDTNTTIRSSAGNLIHNRGGTNYAILDAYNYASYALPRSGGSSYPMTGTLYIATGLGISESTGGNGMLVYHPTSWTGVTSSQWGVGSADSQGVIRSSAANLVHYRGSTSYDILDSYNFVAGTNYMSISGTETSTGTKTFKHADFGGQLVIHRDQTSYDAVITYQNNTGVLGYLGFRGSNSAPYVQIGSSDYNLWHSGNAGTGYEWGCTTLTATGNISTDGVVKVGTSVNSGNSYVGSDAADNIYLKNSSGAALVCEGVVVRRSASVTTGQLGSSTYRWAGVYSSGLDVLGSGGSKIINSGNNYGVLIAGTGGNTIDGYYSSTSSSYAGLHLNYTSSGNASLCVGGGNVGVGTSSPAEKLEVNGSVLVGGNITLKNNYTIRGYNAAGTATLGLLGVDTSNTVYLAWNAAGAGSDTYVSGANVYVTYGTSHTTGAYLSSAGVWRFSIPAFTNFQILRTTSGGSAAVTYYSANQTTNYWAAGADPNSSTTSLAYRFFWYYNGAYKAYLTTGGTLVTTGDQVISSDATLKKNIKDLDLTVEQIAQLPAVTFDWKDGRGSTFGTVAQGVLPIFPQAVRGNEGNYSVVYGQGGWVFGVKNARAIVDIQAHETEQDKEIKKLKARVKELEKRLNIS